MLKLRKEKSTPSTTIEKSDQGGIIQININGDNNVVISPQVLKLSEDQKVLAAIQGVISPLIREDGISEAAFISGKKIEKINQMEAKRLSKLSLKYVEPESPVQSIVGHITVHSGTFDLRARIWDFTYNGYVENIDIGDTNIAEDTLKRGKIVVGDTYKVRMEIHERRTKDGGYKNNFKVVEVLDFKPGDEQLGLELWKAKHDSQE